MLCQRCGSEMFDSSVCPECGTARRLPLSGCLDPETVYEIKNIKPAVQAQPRTATGRPSPRAAVRERDIAVPTLRLPAVPGPSGSDRVMSRGAALVIGALMVMALAACAVSVYLGLFAEEPQPAYAPTPAVETDIVFMSEFGE